MNETEFNARAEGALAAIVRALEASGVECDSAFKGEGVLELEFEDRSRIIVNRHGPAREIWVAGEYAGRGRSVRGTVALRQRAVGLAGGVEREDISRPGGNQTTRPNFAFHQSPDFGALRSCNAPKSGDP